MILAFILTMPNRGSWNGGWSGEDNLYCITKTLPNSKKNEAKAESLIGNHHYSWSDGWGANVEVKRVDSAQARKLRMKSSGFCGYDWMVNNLMIDGDIRGGK